MSDLETPELLRGVLDSLENGVYLCDRNRTIVFWNEAAERITGYPRHDVVGHRSRDNILIQCNEVSCPHCGASCPLGQAVAGGRVSTAQLYLRHKAGHQVRARIRVSPIRDSRGSIIALAASFSEERWSSGMGFHEVNLAAHGCLDLTTACPITISPSLTCARTSLSSANITWVSASCGFACFMSMS